MKITMLNSAGCELQSWDSLVELIRDISRCYVTFASGDSLQFDDPDESYDFQETMATGGCDPLYGQRMDSADMGEN